MGSVAFHKKRDYSCWTDNTFSVLPYVPRRNSRHSMVAYYYDVDDPLEYGSEMKGESVMEVFISSPFAGEFDDVCRTITDAAEDVGLTAFRVDQTQISEPIAALIERKIRESRLVVADLTGSNPNVLNEVGQAQSLGKPTVLISQDKPEQAPFNVRGRYIHRYDRHDLRELRGWLRGALRETTSPNEVLRSMLVPSSLGHPTRDSWFVIAASPLSYRRAMGRSGGFERARRTSSDYVGIRDILQSFGLLYGFEALPDNLDPEDYADKAIRDPMNLYCIASPKANRWTGTLLTQFAERWVPRVRFRADPTSHNLKNIKVSLFSDAAPLQPPGWSVNTEGDRYYRDFGLIVRGPNPYHAEKMAAILAGRSSLGTEAACRAFTNVAAIDEIRRRLRGLKIDIEEHGQAFWALVSMHRQRGDGKEEADLNTLKVHQVDSFQSLP